MGEVTCEKIRERFETELGTNANYHAQSIEEETYIVTSAKDGDKDYYVGVTMDGGCAIRLFDKDHEPLTGRVPWVNLYLNVVRGNRIDDFEARGEDRFTNEVSVLKHTMENLMGGTIRMRNHGESVLSSDRFVK